MNLFIITKMINTTFNAIHFEELVSYLDNKRVCAEIIGPKKSTVISILRVIKYLFFFKESPSTEAKKPVLHLSLESYTKDVGHYGLASPMNVLALDLRLKLSIFLWSLYLLPRSSEKFKSEIVIALIFYQRIKSTKVSVVHFYGYSYVYEVSVLSFLLTKDPDVEYHFHETQNFLDYGASIYSDVSYYHNMVLVNFAKKNCKTMFFSTKFRVENKPKKVQSVGRDIKYDFGFYSEGYYSRDCSFLNRTVIHHGREVELEIIEFLINMCQEYRDVKVKYYPHLRRGVENAAGIKDFFSKFSVPPNFYINYTNERSSDEFHNVDVGLTIRSTVFWDRVDKDYACYLVKPFFNGGFLDEPFIKERTLNLDESILALIRD